MPGPIETILQTVAAEFDMTKDQILSRNRTPTFVHARALAVQLTRQSTSASFPQIARALCRDSSTIQTAFRRAPEFLARDPELARKRQAIVRKLQAEGINPR